MQTKDALEHGLEVGVTFIDIDPEEPKLSQLLQERQKIDFSSRFTLNRQGEREENK